MLTPSPNVQANALEALKKHSKRYRRKGVSEFRGHFKANLLFVEVVKEAKSGLVGRIFGIGNVRGVGRLARLEYLGPNKWKLLIFKYDSNKYGSHPRFTEGTLEACVDAAAEIYIS